MPRPMPRPADAVSSPLALKIVIAGGFGAGKTTAVRAVSEIEPLTTEEQLTEAGALVDDLEGVERKQTTTVAFDFGRLSLDGLELFLFGTPGQQRFVDLWYELVQGAIGAVVLVDTRRLEDSFPPVGFFEQLRIPFVVAINCFDGAHRYPTDDVRNALGLASAVPVIPCDARVPDQVASVLLTLTEHAMQIPYAPTALQDA
ncbi:ATP/GTP-binding protein [Streptomyces sp. NPDC048208]|uniref:GTP-binding protein n=1 Tax=Streptomyces sp. NPDC048208 TaxID=3365515 RepID=UPI0037167C54